MNRSEEPRTTRCTVRWSASEWSRLRRLASKAGLTPSSYLRAVGLAEPPTTLRVPRTARVRFTERRTQRCEVLFHRTEWERVCTLAATVNLRPAHFVREVAVGYQLASRADAQAIRQLARCGNNLNQLTRLAHTLGLAVVAEQLEPVLTRLRATLDRLL